MFGKLKSDEVPVLYQITNLSQKGWNYFELDSLEYSMFPIEQEVLFCSGSSFEIEEISEEFNEQNGLVYVLANLKFHDDFQEPENE